MTEIEYLQHALKEAKRLSEFLNTAYELHDHELDLHGGVALSAAKLSAQALEQEITGILLSIK